MNSQPAERAPQTQQSKQNERQIELHHREWLEAFAGLLAWGLPGAPSSGRWMNWGAQGHSRVCFAERWLMLPLSSREPLPLPHSCDLVPRSLRARILPTAGSLHPWLQRLGLGEASAWPLRSWHLWALDAAGLEEWQLLKCRGGPLESLEGPEGTVDVSSSTLRPWG